MTMQMNKEKSRTKRKRASAPGMTRKGSLTIEAAFGIPLFLFAALCLIWLIEIQSIRISILNAAQSAAKAAAESTAVFPVLDTGKLKSDMADILGKERMERSILYGGASGVSLDGSYLSPVTGEIKVCLSYRVKIPLPILKNPSARMEETFKVSGWQGYMPGGFSDRDQDIVYVTENGTVYHEDYSCSYLRLSIRYVPYAGISDLRNENGGKYYPCEKCVSAAAMSGVYLTNEGRRYHNSLTCSGLKRTIRAIHRSEAGGLGGCSRCS